MQTVNIITFGYLHGAPPAADITIDLRVHFRDPHFDPALRESTALDQAVRHNVTATPGIIALIHGLAIAARAFLAGPADRDVTVAVGCGGGRHRAAAVGLHLQEVLADLGEETSLTHRDLSKPVVNRPQPGRKTPPA